jgi:hypothetical protein
MLARHRRRYRPAETGGVAPRVFATVSLLALMLASAWFARSQILAPVIVPATAPAAAPVATIPAEFYLGLVQLAPDHDGRCERFEIDNRAAVLRWKGSFRCNDITATTTRRAAPGGALQGVGGYFRSH